MDAYEMIIIYLVVLMLYVFLIHRYNRYLFAALVGILLLGIVSSFKSYQYQHQQYAIVYDIPKTLAIGIIDGTKHQLITDSVFLANPQKQQRVLGNWMIERGIWKKSIVGVGKGGIVVVKEKGKRQKEKGKEEGRKLKGESGKEKVDRLGREVKYMIVFGNFSLPIDSLLRYYKPELVVLNGDLNMKQRGKWKVECGKLNVRNWDMREKGCLLTRN